MVTGISGHSCWIRSQRKTKTKPKNSKSELQTLPAEKKNLPLGYLAVDVFVVGPVGHQLLADVAESGAGAVACLK